jgi:hypothetical protein
MRAAQANRKAVFADLQRRQRWLTTPPLFSTVWARLFCDQQEMSSQTATGRSLP